ncbi:hypothetical protein CRG98_034605 [Punica granatum]|uniref:Uncharacterized protein n=1 Tax=Punica granatum TaxID=22663 RepID=A0A2I0ILV5_PUNGR|nr:hypothetical protein CRG98_034605 [Punica granatum]
MDVGKHKNSGDNSNRGKETGLDPKRSNLALGYLSKRLIREVTTVAPDGILMQGQWLPPPKRPSEVAVVVVWFQTYRVDLYSPAKFTENRVLLENKPDWAVFGSDVTTVSPDGILRQGQCLSTHN